MMVGISETVGLRVDAHQHFWQYNPQEYAWMTHEMGSLRKDYLPEDLQPILVAMDFNGTVAVQARQSLEETRWLLELADSCSAIRGVVGWVDLCSQELEKQLQEFVENQKFCGVRHMIQDEVDDRFMFREDFQRGIATLAEFDLVYDLLLFPKHLPVAVELVSKFPEQRFVLDHMAKPPIKTMKVQPWESDIKKLAANRNVFCKVSGLVTETDWRTWEVSQFLPYLDVVFKVFGAERIMFGSDWPVCTLAGSYREVVKIVADYTNKLTAKEQAQVWGETAITVYRLPLSKAGEDMKVGWREKRDG